MVVLLRVGIGWQFFYEGVSKFDPAANFSAEGFLAYSKGPPAELYYWMLPDLDGMMRLEVATVEDEDGREHDTFIVYENAWKQYFEAYLERHPDVDKEEANVIFNRYLRSLREEARDSKEEIAALKASRARFLEERATVRNDTIFEQERRWNQMIGYRFEAGYWTRLFYQMGNGLQSDLGRLADLQLAGQRGGIVTAPERELIPPNDFVEIQFPIPSNPFINDRMELLPNPFINSRMEVMNWGVKIGLTGIGLCLMLGLFTRLASLAAIVFLANVLLTTWPVPGVFPPIPTVAGSAMFVSKDMVGMLGLMVLVFLPAGRWGGLDYFLWHYGGKQIIGVFRPSVLCTCSKGK